MTLGAQWTKLSNLLRAIEQTVGTFARADLRMPVKSVEMLAEHAGVTTDGYVTLLHLIQQSPTIRLSSCGQWLTPRVRVIDVEVN